MSPLSGISKPASMRSKVVLPQPDGPSSEKNSPRLISKLTSSTARLYVDVTRGFLFDDSNRLVGGLG